MACLPFYNVVTTRGENWLLEGVTVLFFACTYCYLAWGLVWSTGCSLVGASFFRFFLSRTSRAEPSRDKTRQDKARLHYFTSACWCARLRRWLDALWYRSDPLHAARVRLVQIRW